MSVLYLLTSPEPAIEGTDATFQEVHALRRAFGGEAVNLCPRRLPGLPFPPQLFGFHRLGEIRRLERKCEINHLYHSVPYPFPILRFLRNPTVYTVLTSLQHFMQPPPLRRLATLRSIVVSNARDAHILKSWGLSNYAVAPPAIDATRLSQRALPLRDELTLLMASAPWVEDQFDLKGIDALLDAATQDTRLRLILLWRGLLLKELRERVERRGISNRVEIVAKRVEIDDYLKRAHATILAAKRGDIVRAYPHSLLESLVAGKPVILSAALPMADYVRQQGSGVVVEDVSPQSLLAAIQTLRAHYDRLAQRAQQTDSDNFSLSALIDRYREIYRLARQPASLS